MYCGFMHKSHSISKQDQAVFVKFCDECAYANKTYVQVKQALFRVNGIGFAEKNLAKAAAAAWQVTATPNGYLLVAHRTE